MKKFASAAILLLIATVAIPSLAAEMVGPEDRDIHSMQMLAEQVKANKKRVVSQYLELTQDEANKFWPVYRRLPEGSGKNQ